MGLEFCSLASGSSGNCYLVRSDTTNIMIDSGITGKSIILGMEELGMGPEDLDGILLTHEHIDHVRSIRMIGRKAENAVVYGTQGTFAGVEGRLPEGRAEIIPDRDFVIGDITVRAFDLSHDAIEPTGYSMTCGGKKIAIVTDTGQVSPEVFEEVYDSDILVLEANHEVNILKMGPYPYPLKQRILGDKGHLSNDTAGHVVKMMLQRRNEEGETEDALPPRVVLAHLSRENNSPQQAYLTVNGILMEAGFFDGEDVRLSVLRRDQISGMVKA